MGSMYMYKVYLGTDRRLMCWVCNGGKRGVHICMYADTKEVQMYGCAWSCSLAERMGIGYG